MWCLVPIPRYRLDCMNPVPAITLNLEAFKQVMAFALLALPLFTFTGLAAWGAGGRAK